MAASISVWMPVSWWSLSPYISCLTSVPANQPASYNRCIHPPLSGPIHHRKLSKCWKSVQHDAPHGFQDVGFGSNHHLTRFGRIHNLPPLEQVLFFVWSSGCLSCQASLLHQHNYTVLLSITVHIYLSKSVGGLFHRLAKTLNHLHLAVLIQLLQRNMFIHTGQSIKYQYLQLCCQFKSLISYESWITPQQDIG